jgi:hypothetical protein
MNVKNLTLVMLVVTLTTSCSGTYLAYYETLKLAFAEAPDAQMSLADVQQSPIDVMAAKHGERPAAIMALANIENGQHKWISNDRAMLILEKGRIVRTIGLKEDLWHLSNTKYDPLKSLPFETPTAQWLRLADWSSDQYGYPIVSNFLVSRDDTVQALSLSINARLFIEELTYTAPSTFIRLNRSWRNYYWYDKKTGVLIKSIEHISPLSEVLHLTYLSRIARLTP